MGRFFAFWWLCARQAFWGNSAFANDWQWVVGNPLSTVLGGVLAAAFGAAAVTTGSSIFDTFLAALSAFVITWLVVFLIRLFSLPAEYFYKEKGRADRLENVDGRQQAKAKLWVLRSDGVALRNKGKRLRDEVDVKTWTSMFEDWHKAVLENALIHSADLRCAPSVMS